MAGTNKFEDEEIKAQQEFKALHSSLQAKIHPDRFPPNQYSTEINQEAGVLFADLEQIRAGQKRENGRTVFLSTWAEKLHALGDLEDQIKIFLEKAKKEDKSEPQSDQAMPMPENGKGKEKLDKLKDELGKARKEYLDVDYKKNVGIQRAWKTLGNVFKNKTERNQENDLDIAWCRAHYDNKLMEYKTALLDDAKARGVSNKELGEILKFFETEAKVTMADVHTQVKIENQEGRFSETIKNNSMKMVEKYKKLKWHKKLAIGTAFGLVAVGAGATGSAFVMGTALTAATIRRLFLGVVSGTSAALYAEGITNKRTEKKITKEVESTEKQMEGLSQEEIYALLSGKINTLITDENKQINTIKNKNLRNLGIGIGVGATVGIVSSYFGLNKFLHHGEHLSGAGGHAPGAGTTLPHEAPSGHGPTSLPHEAPSGPGPTEVPKAPGVIPHEAAHGTPHGKTLEVDKWVKGKLGGSFEGEIKKYLMEDKGLKRTEAGKMAHRMFLEYQNTHHAPQGFSYDKIMPGARIDLSPDGNHVAGFHDGPGSRWPGHIEKGGVSGQVDHTAPRPTVEEVKAKLQSPRGGGNPVRIVHDLNRGHNVWPNPVEHAEHHPSGTAVHETAHPAEGGGGKGTIIPEKSVNPPIEHPSGQEIPPSGTRADEMAQQIAKGQEIYKKYAFEMADNANGRATKILKLVFAEKLKPENWNSIKELTFSELKEKISDPKLVKRINEARKAYMAILGPEAKPLPREKIVDWAVRIADDSMKEKMYQAA